MKYESGYKDYKSNQGFWVRSERVDGVKRLTNAGQLWNNIEARCNPLSAECTRYPSYIGTENHFEDFQHFAEWCQSQQGYQKLDESGNKYHLDKDLPFLIGESEVRAYSEHSLFIPPKFNQILKFNVGDSELPIGVTEYGDFEYRMQFRDLKTGRKVHGGIFALKEEAHEAWLTEQAHMLVEMATVAWQIENHQQLGAKLMELRIRMLNCLETNKEFKIA